MEKAPLTALSVKKAAPGRDHADGGGLFLRIEADGAGRWVLRYTAPTGERRSLGLGICDRRDQRAAGRSLTEARAAADRARALLAQGLDPIDEKRAARERARQSKAQARAEAQREAATLARIAREYHARVIEPARSPKHAAQWIASLELNVPPAIWHKPIAKVTAPELLDAIAELQGRVPETALRVRQRLETIFDDAEFRGLASGNPARAIRRKLREVKGRRVRGKFAALPYAEAPAFLRDLRTREGIAARALEFAMLTAARTGEVIGATWPEFDLAAALWTVPAHRMKGGQEHAVYLSARAVQIVEAMRDLQQPYVFPSPALDGKPLSNMAMLALLRRMDADARTTVHGLCRASFSTWANETGAARPDVVEACLAHREANLVKAAYNRAQFAKERRALLTAWAAYLEGNEQGATVIPFSPRVA